MRVLIADDDLGSLLVAHATVEALGHECTIASDGAQAWELIQAHRPDVLITDRSMPGMDGLELCRRVRERAEGYTYIVLLTSHDSPQDVLSGMRAGADDYLAKPLEPVSLEARLLAASRVTDLHAELDDAHSELSRQAHTDPLTGLRNRLSLDADLDDLHRGAVRYGTTFCLAMCDVDHFKRYNDTYGHPAGDRALRHVAETLVSELRDVDRIYRFGGEEFLVLLPGQSTATAATAMERARARLEASVVDPGTAGPSVSLTMSVGVTDSDGHGLRDSRDLLAAVDVALYEAKRAGRNTVTCRPGSRLAGAIPT